MASRHRAIGLALALWCATCRAATATTGPRRSVNWWWSDGDAVTGPNDPAVHGLLSFCSAHKNIVTTVIARCGVYTCIRNESTTRPNTTCLNNGGIGGKITGNVSAVCRKVIPALRAMGIRVELWLVEDDSYQSAQRLFAHPEETATDLLALARRHPDIQGFNIDLEPGKGNASDAAHFSRFLGTVTAALNTKNLRFSADVGCTDPSRSTRVGLTTNCRVLAKSGVNRLLNMMTYNAVSYEEWLFSKLAPALTVANSQDVMGVGLGCWVDDRTNNTWAVTPKSAHQRICYLMNQSVTEIDMFRLRQGVRKDGAPLPDWPEHFWIPALERFMSGASCDAEIPTRTVCPNASIGPANSWLPGGDQPHCCVSFSKRQDAEGKIYRCNETCARAECEADPHMWWKPENYSSHPFECCRKPRPD